MYSDYVPRLNRIGSATDFSKTMVVFSILILLAYTAVHLFFSWHEKYIPDSLTYSVFTAFSIELSALAGIKITEKKGEYGQSNKGIL